MAGRSGLGPGGALTTRRAGPGRGLDAHRRQASAAGAPAAWLAAALAFAPAMAPGGEPAATALPAHPRELRFEGARPPLPSAEGRRVELPGGAGAYYAFDPTLPLVEITVALPVGSFLDPPGRAGLTALTGALLRQGGAGGLTAEEFDDRVDRLGLQLDSSAGLARGGASLSALTGVAPQALDALFDMLARPGFQEDRVATARANLLEAMSRRNDDPLVLLEREWEWLLHGSEHFATRPVTPATIGRVTRDELLAHHRRCWRPEGLLFAVSGDFEPAAMTAELSRRLGVWLSESGPSRAPQAPAPADGGAVRSSPAPPRPGEPAFTPTAGLYHVEAAIPQAKVALGHRSAVLAWDEPDRSLIELANELLGGGGAISRLAGRLRTAEGLVYRASSRYLPDGPTPGDFRVFFDTRPSATPRAVAIALEELRRLRTSAARPRELAVVQRTLLGRLRLAFDTAEEVAGYFAEDELLGRPHAYWERHRARLGAATAADVQRVAAGYFQPEELVVLVVGPWRELARGAAPGQSELERAAGHRVVHLPARDPLTLEPLADGGGVGR